VARPPNPETPRVSSITEALNTNKDEIRKISRYLIYKNIHKLRRREHRRNRNRNITNELNNDQIKRLRRLPDPRTFYKSTEHCGSSTALTPRVNLVLRRTSQPNGRLFRGVPS